MSGEDKYHFAKNTSDDVLQELLQFIDHVGHENLRRLYQLKKNLNAIGCLRIPMTKLYHISLEREIKSGGYKDSTTQEIADAEELNPKTAHYVVKQVWENNAKI